MRCFARRRHGHAKTFAYLARVSAALQGNRAEQAQPRGLGTVGAMTTQEQIAALAAEQQRLLGDHTVEYHEKRERLRAIVDRITALYAEKRQGEADRRVSLSDRGRR